jgi:glycosyltransferase involved in cell wall biosynthesis
MKIAVVFLPIDPHIGGGFSFVRNTFEALLEYENKSHHQFFYVVDGAIDLPWQSVPPERLFLRPPQASRLLRAGSLLVRQFEILYQRLVHRREFLPERNWLTRYIEDNSIQLVWFVSPGVVPIDAPYVCTHWDLQHLIQPWFPEVSSEGIWELRQKVYTKAFARAVRVIVANETAKQEIVENTPVARERVLVLPHPTPEFEIPPASELAAKQQFAELGIAAPFLFYPAQFWSHKNHIGALRVLDELNKQSKERFTLVFTGSDQGNLTYVREKAAQLGIESQVRYLGFVDQALLVELYRQAFCLLYLTYFGPENLPPLEAMKFGCPVIASKVAGAAEQYADAAILVEPGQPCQSVEAILRLGRDPAFTEELRQRGYKRAGLWTPQGYMEQLGEFFNQFEIIRECWR